MSDFLLDDIEGHDARFVPASVSNIKALVPRIKEDVHQDMTDYVTEYVDDYVDATIKALHGNLITKLEMSKRVVSGNGGMVGSIVQMEIDISIVQNATVDIYLYNKLPGEYFLPGEGYVIEGDHVLIHRKDKIYRLTVKTAYMIDTTVEEPMKTFTAETFLICATMIDSVSTQFNGTFDLSKLDDVTNFTPQLLEATGNSAAKSPDKFAKWATSGKIINMDVNGLGVIPHRVVAVGHYDLASGGKCGLVLQPTQLIAKVTANNNKRHNLDYSDIGLAATVESTCKSLYGTAIDAIVQSVTIPVDNSGKTISAKWFCPSCREVTSNFSGGGIMDATMIDFGTELAYWASHDTGTNRVMAYQGTNGDWWTRTYYTMRNPQHNEYSALNVISQYNGSLEAYMIQSTSSAYIAPLFCVGSSLA